MIDESLRRIEPIVVRFEKEANALNNLSLNLSRYEKMDFVRRSHTAKDMVMRFDQDIFIKTGFITRLKNQAFVKRKFKVKLNACLSLYSSC